jgi:hypothetical protein
MLVVARSVRLQRGFGVFQRLLGQREPRLRHSEQQPPVYGIGSPLGQINALRSMQPIRRHKITAVHSIPTVRNSPHVINHGGVIGSCGAQIPRAEQRDQMARPAKAEKNPPTR